MIQRLKIIADPPLCTRSSRASSSPLSSRASPQSRSSHASSSLSHAADAAPSRRRHRSIQRHPPSRRHLLSLTSFHRPIQRHPPLRRRHANNGHPSPIGWRHQHRRSPPRLRPSRSLPSTSPPTAAHRSAPLASISPVRIVTDGHLCRSPLCPRTE
ncbi:hypothetical protein DAI22_01g494801 [Oryza sativa Japonica Group]|nr:hypothetical protein DAI22_01g494801 [Oryza sativa Japonica Group]KAF2954601.1 hypothetical protein DAI22_01g494801 [Oryza sativa Japonica Group]KAF2954602.1 hypothetical protein DAI22_01g494801 [Oryza sativa Japonica Group]